MSDAPIYLSLGAGVQSSTLALMAKHGEFDVEPAACVFADTQNESEETYRWISWLEGELPYPVHRVTNGNLFDASMVVRTSGNTGMPYLRNLVPAFVSAPTGEDDGKLRQGCTRDFKIRAIEKTVKELAGVPRRREKGRVYATSWVGISMDEISRMKPSSEPWVDRQYPLIDKRMSRLDCLNWMERHGYPEPPRSSCTFCPHHSNDHWRSMAPADFARAVEFERGIQEATRAINVERAKSEPVTKRVTCGWCYGGRDMGTCVECGGSGMVSETSHPHPPLGIPYLHAGMKPIGETDFANDQPGQGFLFLCDGGVCGV